MIAAAPGALVGNLLCRTADAEIARCLDTLVSQGFCAGGDIATARAITWERSRNTPNWQCDALTSASQTPSRRWGSVGGSLHQERPLFRISDNDCCWIAAPDRVCVLGTPAPTDPRWIELLAVVVLELLAAAGTVAIHAGAATVGGQGMLIVGPSGAGKSTLVYLLAQAGGSYTTDDVALISRQGDTWVASSTGGHLRLRPTMTIDDGLMHNDGLDALGKLHLQPRRPEVCCPSTRIDRLVFLEPGHGAETTWRSLDRHDVVERLMSEAALALSPAVASRQLVSLGEIAQLPAVTLRSGQDLIDHPDLASSIFAGIWAGQAQP